LVAEGYERATTNRIAEVAGVSIGTLYQYFHDRDAILAMVAEDMLAAIIAAGEEGLRSATCDGLQHRLELVVTGVLRVVARYPSVLRHLDAVPGASFRARLSEAKGVARALLVQLLALHADELRGPDRELSARMLADVGEGLLYNLASDDDVELVGREAVRLWLSYLS